MLVRAPVHGLLHMSRKTWAIASGSVPSGQALGTQDSVNPREKLAAQQLACRTETLDPAEALTRERSRPRVTCTQGPSECRSFQTKAVHGPPNPQKKFYPSFGVSQESGRLFP